MTERIILYGSLTCPMVPPVRSLLRRAQRATPPRREMRRLQFGNWTLPRVSSRLPGAKQPRWGCLALHCSPPFSSTLSKRSPANSYRAS